MARRHSRRRRWPMRLVCLEKRIAPALVPFGPEFRVNTYTTVQQYQPAVASDDDGDLVVAWASVGQDGDGLGIYAQRFLTTGVAIGSEFRVNTHTIGDQSTPAIAIDPDGDFAITWSSGHDGDIGGIFLQRFSAAGSPLGPEIQVNGTTTGKQSKPAIAMDDAGNFVVAWEGEGPGDSDGIFAQRYSNVGLKLGGEFRINSVTVNNQHSVDVVCDPQGNFVVSWVNEQGGTAAADVMYRYYLSTGSPLISETRVNDYTTSSQLNPKIASNRAGEFVIAWESPDQDGSQLGIFARRFSDLSFPIGIEFLVNTTTLDNQYYPAISMDSDGDFMIAWTSSDGGGLGVFAQQFAADGSKIGAELLINTTTTNYQALPAIARDAEGNTLVVWEGIDESSIGIFAQRYLESDDQAGPIVTHVGQTALTSIIADGDLITGTVTSIVIGFSEDMATASPGSVTNIANWRVLRNGLDVTGTIDQVNYGFNNSTRRHEASLNFDPPLGDGHIVLTALHSLSDVVGNQLDGVVDGHLLGEGVSREFRIATPDDWGPEFRVNTITTNAQALPQVAVSENGNHVIVWSSLEEDGSNWGIYAQLYDESAAPIGPQFRVNTYTTDAQFAPVVAMNAGGAFVIAWENLGDIYAQRFSAASIAQGGEFRVNQFTTYLQSYPDIAMDADGDFVVTWRGQVSVPNSYDIYARRFDGAGVALGNEFLVNSSTANTQHDPAIAMNDSGSFVITWNSDHAQFLNNEIYAQQFDSAGNKLGPEMSINTFTTQQQGFQDVGIDANGIFVIVWQSMSQDVFNTDGIYARRYSPTGTALSDEFRVNETTDGHQRQPAIDMRTGGEFFIVWAASEESVNSHGIVTRRYRPDGTPASGEFTVNSYTMDNQAWPDVGIANNGRSIIVWESPGQDGDSLGIYAQRYAPLAHVSDVFLVGDSRPLCENEARMLSPQTQILVEFAGNLSTSGGAGGTNSVTNPANWVVKDDGLPMAINQVDYIANAQKTGGTATLKLAASITGSIAVSYANLIDEFDRLPDGNFDGIVGGQWTRKFRVTPVQGSGLETQVNTTTTGNQNAPVVALDAAGNSVVVWASATQDPDGSSGIYVQRFNSAGIAVGLEFRANTYTTGSQLNPAVAMNLAGDFVVVWQSTGPDGNLSGISAQRFNAAGVAQGTEFVVNQVTTGNQITPAVAMNHLGAFVVSWNGPDANSTGIYARQFAANGAAVSSDILVNNYLTSAQDNPSVAMDSDGDFVVVWSSNGQDGDNHGIYAQRFNRLGIREGSEFRVNMVTTAAQSSPAVAMDFEGNFAVSWQSNLQDGGGLGIVARCFHSNGGFRGFEFLANTFTTGTQRNSAIALDADGDIVVAWESAAQDGSSYGVYARRFQPSGTPIDLVEFRVNSFTPGTQSSPTISASPNGDLAVAWRSVGQDGDGDGVYMQRFFAVPPPSVTSILVNNDLSSQRSMVTSITVTFSETVNFPAGIEAAFSLQRTAYGTLGLVGISFNPPSGPASQVTITFNNSGAIGIDAGNSLADGKYLLSIHANQIVGYSGTLDGDNDYISEGSTVDDDSFEFHRLFGDEDGDAAVTSDDFAEFRRTFGTNLNLAFDFNNNGTIDSDDFSEFRKRFGISFLP